MKERPLTATIKHKGEQVSLNVLEEELKEYFDKKQEIEADHPEIIEAEGGHNRPEGHVLNRDDFHTAWQAHRAYVGWIKIIKNKIKLLSRE